MRTLDTSEPLSKRQPGADGPTPEQDEEGGGMGETVANILDFTLGNLCRGIGYGAFHAQRVPGVGHTARAAGRCFHEGYTNAQRAHRIHNMVSRIAADRKRGPVSEATIVSMCRDASFSQEEINRVLEIATQDARTAHKQEYVSSEEVPAAAPA